jgi:hypothetical protein
MEGPERNAFDISGRFAMKLVRSVLSLMLPLAMAGCGPTPSEKKLGPAPPVEILENGLGQDRSTFYHTAEGSELFPKVFLEAAQTRETPSRPFLDTLEDYGLIRDGQPSDTDPMSLGYIGLTVSKNKETKVDLVGVNCAACHVGQIETADGKRIRIDGAPNMFDIIGFFNAITKTKPNVGKLASGIVDDMKSNRWYNLLSPVNFAGNVDSYVVHLTELAPLANGTTPMAGRADAFGAARAVFFGDTEPLTAVTSFPSVWGFQREAWFHWNANTNSALERNIGQAIGLGASFDLSDCSTSLIIDSLAKMEKLAYKIQPPAWPEQFLGAIDKTKAKAGKAIYMKECAKCHDNYKDIENGPGNPRYDYTLFSLAAVGTDPYEAMNSTRDVVVNSNMCLPAPTKMATISFADAHNLFLGRVRDAAIAKYLKENPDKKSEVDNWGDHRTDSRFVDRFSDPAYCDPKNPRACPIYPAKPLVGIWASPPYLHNGSVPSMMDLLKPASERPDHFLVGQRRYDTKTMGYDQNAGQGRLLSLKDSVGNFFSGDSNAGHEYGTKLAETEKLQLIEFLKSLKPCSADDKAKAAAGGEMCYDQDELRQEFQAQRKPGQ